MRIFTEQEWWRRANRQAKWKAAFGAELTTLEAQIESCTDLKAIQKIIDRVSAIQRRLEQVQLVMERHLERAPDMFPDIKVPSQIGSRMQ